MSEPTSTVEEVAPGVLRIALPVPSLKHGVNVHLVRGDGPLTLVDTAIPLPGTVERLEAALADHGVRISDLEQVLLTHHHFDHIGLAGEIVRRSDARIVALPELDGVLRDPAGHFRIELDWGGLHVVRHGAPEALMSGTRRALPLMATLPTCGVDRTVDEGDVMRAGDLELTVHRRPGHSPTDTVFADPERGLAFVGDHLFVDAPITPVLGSMVADDGRPAAAYLESLERTVTAPLRQLFAGHGPTVEAPVAFLAQRRAALDRKVQRAHAALDTEPVTAWDLGGRVWRRSAADDGVTYGLTRLAALLAALELLEADGRAQSHTDAAGRTLWSRAA